jgi:regulator of nucleoside diphosphate kinase
MTRVVSIPARDRTLTELDWIRIRRCIGHSEPDCAPYAPFDDMLEDAAIVPVHRVGPDVVTMYSQLLLRLLPDGEAIAVTPCYPRDDAPSAGFVSVLSPLGRAVVGRRVGDLAQWAVPDGPTLQAEIAALLFQPEANGDYAR